MHQINDTLRSIIYVHSEHFSTCNTSDIIQLIINLEYTMNFLGTQFIYDQALSNEYDFQYFLNYIKNVPHDKYKNNLHLLCQIYGIENIKRSFKNIFYLTQEIENIVHTYQAITLNHDVYVFDIDGTVTIDRTFIERCRMLLQKDKFIVFITGRPKKYINSVIDLMHNDGLARLYGERIILYFANGYGALNAQKNEIFTGNTFTANHKRILCNYIDQFGLKIVSERDYRVIAKLEGKQNPNYVLSIRDQIRTVTRAHKFNFEVSAISFNSDEELSKTNDYDAVDITSNSKRICIEHLMTHLNNTFSLQISRNDIVVLANEPSDSDINILTANYISVEGLGELKTRCLLDVIINSYEAL